MKIIKYTIKIILATTILFSISCNIEDGNKSRTLEQDLMELNEFILKKESEGYNVDTTSLGVYYILREEGDGPYPEPKDTCFIKYRSYLLNGSLIENSENIFPNGIWKFVHKEADMISGLKDGISLMNKGCQTDLIIPSHLAYGAKGTADIHPYNTLIYVISMHDIKPPED